MYHIFIKNKTMKKIAIVLSFLSINLFGQPPITVRQGGTNNTSTLTKNGVNYFDGNKITNSGNFLFYTNPKRGLANDTAFIKLTSNISALGTYATDYDPYLVVQRSYDSTLNQNGHTFVDASIFKRHTSGNAQNSYTDNSQYVGNASYNHHASFQSQFNYNAFGTLTTLYGFVDIPTVNSGTITNRRGIDIYDVAGSGSVTNNIGIYVRPLSKGGTSNWGVYVQSNQSYFGGGITFSDATTYTTAVTLSSGTYTPTISNTTNISTYTVYPTHYSQVGNMVTVSGGINITLTTGSILSELSMSLPIASNVSNVNNTDCGGVATSYTSQSSTWQIAGDNVNHKAWWLCTGITTGSIFYSFNYSYYID
jgi:hypothetical protein